MTPPRPTTTELYRPLSTDPLVKRLPGDTGPVNELWDCPPIPDITDRCYEPVKFGPTAQPRSCHSGQWRPTGRTWEIRFRPNLLRTPTAGKERRGHQNTNDRDSTTTSATPFAPAAPQRAYGANEFWGYVGPISCPTNVNFADGEDQR